MTYAETLEYLYQQLPMFSRIGAAAYKEDLHNTIALCEGIGRPQDRFKSIHIAGTNGKGSTSHMLAAVLQEAGYKTGLYTSPHIKDFGERIRVNGRMIDEQFVIDFVKRTGQMTEEIKPSFFELTVAMAFDYFAQQEVDIAVIETGLGGLLDSTNIIQPVLSVITNISYDHQHILGRTLGEIAVQKAGIIKQDTPVVIGERHPETEDVFTRTAKEKKAAILFAEDIFSAEYIENAGELLICHVKNNITGVVEKLRTTLSGTYQAKNICTVLAAVDRLQKLHFNITEDALHKGLEEVKKITGFRGRWEILENHPHIIADVGHNKAGIQQIILQLQQQYTRARLHFILGFVKDKEVEEVLQLFPGNASYYFTNAHLPRALPHEELKAKAEAAGIKGNSYDNVNEALTAARKDAGFNDVIMICGSFFILAELDGF